MNQKLLEAIEMALKKQQDCSKTSLLTEDEFSLIDYCFRDAIQIVRLEFERFEREEEQKGDE